LLSAKLQIVSLSNPQRHHTVTVSKNHPNLTLRLLTILFTLATVDVFTQSIFYFDYQIDSSKFAQLEKMNNTAEKSYEDYVFFESPMIPLANSETKELLAKKSKLDLNYKNEIRAYIKFNDSFDTLKVLGYSLINYVKNKPIILYMLPLISIEHNTEPSDYMTITEVLYYSLRDYMKSGTKHRLIPAEYDLKNEFEILKPFFYSFTDAEWRLYRDPFNNESIVQDRMEAHHFVSNGDSIYISYNKFPIPEKMKFIFDTKVHLDSRIEYNHYEWHSNNMTNMLITFDFENIGLEFKSKNEIRSYWALYNDIQSFINRNETYKVACNLFFSEAIRNKFIAVEYNY